MGETRTLTSISLRPRGEGNNSPTKAGEFYVCDSYDNNAPENANWQKIGDYTMDATGNDQLFNVKKIPGRYLRILMTQIRSGDGTTSLAEVNAYGY
ncbi:MAG: discoidin domain-containing protein [Niabella sp.]